MKRSEFTALTATLGLLIAAAICLAAVLYAQYTLPRPTLQVALWAGMLAALGHAVVAGLATWGIRLARQQSELSAVPALGSGSSLESARGFRMSFGDDIQRSEPAAEIRTLETGFQRVVVLLAGVAQLILAAVMVYMVYQVFRDFRLDSSKGFPVPPQDPLTIVIAVGVLAIYATLFFLSPIRRGSELLDEPVNSLTQVGMLGAFAVAAATVLAWFGVKYAVEIAAGVFAFILAVQGLELIANALRSYAAVEEFDQEPVDLQTTPLVPMLSSFWLPSLKMLATDSLGLRRDDRGERGVFARMMPRALVAGAILAVLVSMLRVVPPGEVAILERWGKVVGSPDPEEINKAVLRPGLHFTAPWPIDQLIYIPKDQVRMVPIGQEVEQVEGAPVNHHFWATPRQVTDDATDQLVTGDHDPQTGKLAPQMLESFAGVWWRVKDPGRFYMHLSHSEFFEQHSAGTRARPIFEALVQQYAWRAMSRGFATHSAETIMTSNRVKVEEACRKMLQDDLNKMDAGIEVVQFTIKDVHPPYGKPMDAGNGETAGSPAAAYEMVVRRLEEKERDIVVAKRKAAIDVITANGEGPAMVLAAEAQRIARVSGAKAEAERISRTVAGFTSDRSLVRSRLYFNALNDLLGGVNKIVVGKDLAAPTLVQQGRDGPVNVTPLQPPGGPPR